MNSSGGPYARACFGECRDDAARLCSPCRRHAADLDHQARPDRLAIPIHALCLAALGRRRCRRAGTLVRGQREPRAGARIPRLRLDELHAGAAGRGDAVLRHHLCRRHQRRFIGAVEDVLSARRGHAGCSAVFRLQLLDRRNGRHVRDQPLELRQQLRRRDRCLARDPRRRPLLAPGAGRQRGAGRHAECRRPHRLRHHRAGALGRRRTGSIRSWACGCTTSRRWRTN